MRGGRTDPLQRPQEVILCCRRNTNTLIFISIGLLTLFCGAEMERSTLLFTSHKHIYIYYTHLYSVRNTRQYSGGPHPPIENIIWIRFNIS